MARTANSAVPAAFNPPGTAAPAPGGYRVTASWPSASGCDMGTHHLGSAIVTDADGKPTAKVVQLMLERSQYRIVDDWHVMGMQGTGSKRVVVEDAFVPAHRAIAAVAPGRGSEPAQRPGLHPNPMYLGRIAAFLIGETASVAVGAARGALDLYEETLRVKRTYHPPHHERHKEPEYQLHYGRALTLIATAEAALAGAGTTYMDYARDEQRRDRAIRRGEGSAAHPDRAEDHRHVLGGRGADLPHGRHLGRRQAGRRDRTRLPQHGGHDDPPGAPDRPHRHECGAGPLRPCAAADSACELRRFPKGFADGAAVLPQRVTPDRATQ